MAKESKKILNFWVDEDTLSKFKTLCSMNKTTMTKVLTACVEKYVAVEMQKWSDYYNTPKEQPKEQNKQ
jgi:hypothetical protein